MLSQILALAALELSGFLHAEIRKSSTALALHSAAPDHTKVYLVRDLALQLLCVNTLYPAIGSVLNELVTNNTAGLEFYKIPIPKELKGAQFKEIAARLHHAIILGCGECASVFSWALKLLGCQILHDWSM